ncbi:MAG: UDP-N-acetylmuramate dehydrogenase [Clostridia bacterium]|nr:UDP-N-acetylmuramate dehydrogenase [Clostridia bacterium]
MKTITKKLETLCSCVLEHEPLSRHTSFKIGGPCDWMVMPQSVEEVKQILAFAKEETLRVTLLGNGSNVLAADEGIDGIVLKTTGLKEISVKENYICAGAGARLSALCETAKENSLGGLAELSGIPGTVGGGVYMNAGAYGGEIKDTLVESLYLDETNEIRKLTAEEHHLSYRYSIFHEHPDWMILESKFYLTPANRDEIHAKTVELLKKRNEKQPLEYPNAGSTFKRPEGYFAGKLIEDAGLRGFSVGDAQVSEKHCGFVINRKNATAEDVCNLIAAVRERVQKEFGVTLEAEVRYFKRNCPEAKL